MKKLILPIFCGVLLFSACESKTANKVAFDSEAAKKDIESWQEQFESAVKNKDSVAFANLYSEDAIRMAPNTTEIQGRSTIQSSVVEPFKFIGTTDLVTTDAFGNDSTLTCVGTYQHYLPNGSPLEKGKYISIFKRIDGKLLVVRDIWNSDSAGK
jgi:ketosteroid isomerase-like protein